MSTLRTFNLQNPDSGTVNIEMDQGGNTLMTGIATVRGAAHFTSTSGSDAVGIGTDITAYKLDVRVTGAEAGLRVYNPDTSSNASGMIRLGNDDNQNAAFLRLNGSNNTSAVGGAGSLVLGHGLSKNLHLSTAGASRFAVRSDGKISAGTLLDTNNSYEFSIRGADGTGCLYAHGRNHYLSTRSTSHASLTLKKSNSDSDGVDYLQLRDSSNTGKFIINGDGTLQIVDSINHLGDTNTKIRFPAADTITAETGGSERLRITSAGLVGVNCTPLSQFQVKGGTNANIALTTMSSEAAIEAFNDAGSANVPLRFRASAHKFFIGSTEGLRVHTNGLIGVGYDSPTAYGRMTVAMPSQSGGAAIQVANSSNGSGDGSTSNIVLRSVNNSGSNWADAEYRASQHIFSIQGTEKIRLNSDGRLIINATNNPTIGGQTPYLRVNGGYANLDGLRVRGLDTGNTIWKTGGDMGITVGSAHSLKLNTNSATGLEINANGHVTKPLSPAFQASLGGGNLNMATHNSVVVFNNEHFDKSNSYDASNGRFTAPVAGLYYFGVQIYAGFNITGVRVLHAQFQKNGSDIASVDMFGGASNHGGTYYHPTGCGHMLIQLAVNDWVAFNSGGFSGSGSGSAFIYASSGTRFFGYLVG